MQRTQYLLAAAFGLSTLLMPVGANAQNSAVIHVQFFDASALPRGLYRHPTSELSVAAASAIGVPTASLTAVDFAPNGEDLFGINAFGGLTPRGIARYSTVNGAVVAGTFREISGYAAGIFESITDFTIDPISGGAMLTTATETGVGRLYQLDLSSGALSLVGVLAEPVNDLAIDCSARMVGTLSRNAQLVQVNRQSGALTPIGTQPASPFARNIDFDNRTGALFAWAEGSAAGESVAFGRYTAAGEYVPQNNLALFSAGTIANRCQSAAIAVPAAQPIGLLALLLGLMGLGAVFVKVRNES